MYFYYTVNMSPPDFRVSDIGSLQTVQYPFETGEIFLAFDKHIGQIGKEYLGCVKWPGGSINLNSSIFIFSVLAFLLLLKCTNKAVAEDIKANVVNNSPR